VLYSRTLFRYGRRLLGELGPAIELGRSFVRPEYQRESNVLLMLWRGIGAFVAREPRYRYLFGAVSMSADYQSLTRQLVARFLSTGAFASELAGLVRPRRPLPLGPDAAHLVQSRVATSLDDVERLVHELEGDRGLPVLLRQYLKLNARLLGFSVDPAFANVLDGLVLVDLPGVTPALLQRYLGRDAAATIRAVHAPPATPAVDRALPDATPLS
jgi:putative hemolysin